MANGSNAVNFSNENGEALLAPFINLQARYFESELAGDPSAINNICWSYQALATMTLDTAGGVAVKELDAMKTKVHTLINQHTTMQINALHTKDDDYIYSLRDFSKEAIERVKCVISRFIIKICTQSFSHTVMLGCTIKDTNKLAFDITGEYATAKQEVLNELITLGLEEVAVAFYRDAEGIKISDEAVQEYNVISERHIPGGVARPGQAKFGSSRYRGPTRSDYLQLTAEHPGALGEVLWQAMQKQWAESRNIHAHEG